MITSFNKTNLRELRQDINIALNAVAAKHGIKLEMGTIRFSEGEARAKLTMATQVKQTMNTITGTATLPSMLNQAAVIYKLDLNKRGPKGERLVDYVRSRYKYPFTYETVRGTRYKCSEAEATRMFGV